MDRKAAIEQPFLGDKQLKVFNISLGKGKESCQPCIGTN
jgi:hypothetical protein